MKVFVPETRVATFLSSSLVNVHADPVGHALWPSTKESASQADEGEFLQIIGS